MASFMRNLPFEAYLCKWCQILYPKWRLVSVLTPNSFWSFSYNETEEMMCRTSFLLFQTQAKLIYHVVLTILHKFSKRCFPIPFSALNSEELDSFWYLLCAISSEKHTLFAKEVDDFVCQKTTLFYAFCVRRWVASHVVSDTPVLWSCWIATILTSFFFFL